MDSLSSILNLDPAALGVVVFRTLAVYLVLLALLRLFGKRELGQMAPFDLVVILLISNAVQNAMVGPDNSLSGGLVAAFSLLSANWVINRLALRSARLQRLVIGQPVVLINHGQFVDVHMQREGLTRDQVITAMREHGVARAEDVELAVLEVDGMISFVPADAEMKRTQKRVRGRKPGQ